MPQITVDDITVDVVRKNIKNIHLGVYPPNGRVRLAVPLRIDDEAARLAVVSKLSWIRRQKARFEAQARQSQREYVAGESHYFLGQRYLMNVIYQDGPPKVVLVNKTRLDLYTRPGSSVEQRERVLQNWYRQQLRLLIPPLISKWEPVMSVQVAEWGIRRMKTRWGSCNEQARRIWINLELAKKPEHCLEYIVVHEMTHLLERGHGERFKVLMSKHLPHWQLLRDELNREPLGHEEWGY